jgi:hypothetical protein
VAVYPGLFSATDAFRNSRLDATQDPHRHLAQALEHVDAWHAAEGGLILSMLAYEQLIGMRRAVRRFMQEPADSRQLDRLRHDIWERKGQLRAAMRADLDLLFDEDTPDIGRWMTRSPEDRAVTP